MDRIIYIYAGWERDNPLIGIYRADRARKTVMFRYEETWIAGHGVNIDPALALTGGWQFLPHPGMENTFGFLADASPDRWGRNLIRRRESHAADAQRRRARTLMAEDYLIQVSDTGRQGGLRFKEDPDGAFMSPGDEIPRMTDIRELEQSSRILEQASDPREYQALAELFDPGSSLGGARPKANVRDTEGNIWIAKFPSIHDRIDTGAWEMTAHDLAGACGIRVPEARLMRIDGRTIFLSKRFDRQGGSRIHMMSMMTALTENDSSASESGKGFLDMAEYLSFSGADVDADLRELFRRAAYSVCISNTDCHLRNHALLLSDHGWVLSPAYDMNPNPERDTLAVNITDSNASIDMDLVRETAPFYHLSEEDAESMIRHIQETVRGRWRQTADHFQIAESEKHYMERAFQQAEG